MSEGEGPTLEHTPTWVVAAVCTVIVAISLAMERLLHFLGKYLKKKQQKPLFEALQKVKEELMLLGFISLLLTVFQGVISKICVPSDVVDNILPCKRNEEEGEAAQESNSTTTHFQRAFTTTISGTARRLLSEASSSHIRYCAAKNKVPLLSLEALHHLHIFIFILAIVHVTFCVLTVLFGGANIRRWKHWEDAVAKDNFDQEQVLKKRKVTHVNQHAFIQEHFLGIGKNSALLGWLAGDGGHVIYALSSTGGHGGMCLCLAVFFVKARTNNDMMGEKTKVGFGYIHKIRPDNYCQKSFFKQFYGSVTKSDYITLRLGFIMTHCKANPKFNFHKYMMRALEDDFKKVVGISWYLWIFVVIFLLLNINGWHTYFWIAFLPFFLLLAVGTKLEHVISQLAHEVAEKHVAIEGDLVVKPSDHHFWFSRPRIVLFLIHFILFQNAFEIAFFFWILVQYGFNSCIMGHVRYIIPRLVIGVFIQVLCSYSTLPLYAIVTQMGSTYKKVIFDEHIQVGVLGWAQKAKRKKGLKAVNKGSSPGTGQASSHDGSSVAIQLVVHKASTPEEIQPSPGIDGSK